MAGSSKQRHMAAPAGMLLSGFSNLAMGATVLPAPQPTVPVAFRSRMHAGLLGCTILIAALSWPTLEMLAALHIPAQHKEPSHESSKCRSCLPSDCFCMPRCLSVDTHSSAQAPMHKLMHPW